MRPIALLESEVRIPGDAHPVQLEPLHLELGRCVFKAVTGTDILLASQEPMHGIDFDCRRNVESGLLESERKPAGAGKPDPGKPHPDKPHAEGEHPKQP